MNTNVGGQIRGEDFFGREKEVNRIWKSLKKQSVMLTAPRRVGKTTILYNLHDCPENNWLPIFTDLEKCKSPEEFVLDLLAKGKDKALLNKISQWFKDTLNKIENIGYGKFGMNLSKTPQGWKELGNDIFRQFASNLNGKRVLFLWDEFPLMLANIIKKKGTASAIEVLHWAREIRQDVDLGQKFRFVYAGSIGMEVILNKLEAHGAMNDVENIILKPFFPAVTKKFVQELFVGEKFFPNQQSIPPAILDNFLKKSGNIPFFIQMLVAAVSRLTQEEALPVSPEIIFKAYHEGVLGRDNRHYFKHYCDRLSHYYSPKEKAVALNILAEIARIGEAKEEALFQSYLIKTPDGDSDKFNNLMGFLEGDFYLKYVDSKKVYRFWSRVLRDWWRKYKL